MKYILTAFIFIAACSSTEENLEARLKDQQKDLDKLKAAYKLKSDSFHKDASLSGDSAFRKRVEWLGNEMHAVQTKIDTLNVQLKRLKKGDNKEEEEEGG